MQLMIVTKVVYYRAVSIIVRRRAMDDDVLRLTHMTTKQVEETCLVAARLLRQGPLSQAEIARSLGVSRASV